MPNQRSIGTHRTTVSTKDGVTTVTYHHTPVVSFNHEYILLDSGGWKTQTTKTRMNQTSAAFELGFYVRQKDFSWYVTYKDKVIPFDGYKLKLERED